MVGRGQGAGERREAESGVGDEQRALAVEAVHEKASDKSGDGGREPVRGDEVGELGGSDVEHSHELRTERHHDHEIDDVRELHRTERKQRRDFATLSEGMVIGAGWHKGRSVGLFIQSAIVSSHAPVRASRFGAERKSPPLARGRAKGRGTARRRGSGSVGDGG